MRRYWTISFFVLTVLVSPVTAGLRATAPSSASDWSIQRTRIDDANTARRSGDYAGARERAAAVVADLLARPESERDPDWFAVLDSAADAAYQAQDPRTANSAWTRVLEFRVRTLPDDHSDLQTTRRRLALTLKSMGDLQAARSLEEKVLDVCERTLPDDDSDLQRARSNYAVTIKKLGDLRGARTLEERVLEVRTRTLPEDHPELQRSRLRLAATIKALGDLKGARTLEESVLEVYSRTLSEDDPDLQIARLNLGATLFTLGELHAARELFERVLEARTRTLADDHPDMQFARGNLAATISALGDLHGARTLEEKVLAVRSSTLPDDHPDLQEARQNLALTIHELGDVRGSRALLEKVLEVRSRTLPDDHPDLQWARQNLAVALARFGDWNGAKALDEKVFEICSSTLADDHPDLQQARHNLAASMYALGETDAARALEEKVLDVCSSTLPDDHEQLQLARGNLAVMIQELGELQRTRELFEKVYEVRSRTLPDDHHVLQWTRSKLADAIARELALARFHGDTVPGKERCVELIDALCRAGIHDARAAVAASSGREAEERCSSLSRRLGSSLSFALGYGVFEPPVELASRVFEFSETTRSVGITAAEIARSASGTAKYTELRAALRVESDELAALARRGATSEEFDRARLRREAADREIKRLATESSGAVASVMKFDVGSLVDGLGDGTAAIGYRRYTRTILHVSDENDSTAQPKVSATFVESLCAFVVRGRSSPALIDLGPMARIEEAVAAWRASLGVAHESRGVGAVAASLTSGEASMRARRLRELVFDPIASAVGDAQRLVFAPDDVLHLIPMDALPLGGVASSENRSEGLLGDRWRIEMRATLTELVAHSSVPSGNALVALGGATFDAPPRGPSAEDVASDETGEPTATHVAAILRGGAWDRGFSPLPGTSLEVREIATLHDTVCGNDAHSFVLDGRFASRESLDELAPRARFLHVATHGWFASESIRSWEDPEPLDAQTRSTYRQSGTEQVRGMSPMLLCGLALAGANLPEDVVGRAPGLITAEEISTLDLSNCELAVLSACDTNLGERRAGQGVASLQKALQMAGARSVITSLWKVPDDATAELMLDFYRRLWIRNEPKWQALWEAKRMLREARDERGKPKYAMRDWAAWVLTGSPD